MSDSNLPPLRPSSSAGEASNSGSPTQDKNANETYAFLNHSQDSVTNGEPPSVDNVKLAAQKRRRTSPEDQATLEAEYKANPKPDKAARLEIVKKVSLGEKAVQIWFQNRRQNTRRKSRPLLPHEIAAFGLGGMAALSSDPITNFSGSQGSPYYPSSSQNAFSSSQEHSDGLPVPHLPSISPGHVELPAAMRSSSVPAATPSKPSEIQHPSSEAPTDNPSSLFHPLSQPILPIPVPATAPGYLANRRSASSGYFGTPSGPHSATFSTPISFPPIQPSSCPERLFTPQRTGSPSSEVRLSMSLDGKASLVPTTLTNSPPRPQASRPITSQSNVPQRRFGSLQRSQSALPYSHAQALTPSSISRGTPSSSSTSSPYVPRLASGRSRDARTWEFCCDSDARDELTMQAENESHGSAVAAISLLRSTSSNALKANMNKRNAPAVSTRQDEEKDAGGKQIKRAKLGRAQSSVGRLQSEKDVLGIGRPVSKKGGEILRSPGGDSDKENWIPTEGGGHRRSQPHNISNSASSSTSASGSSAARLGQKQTRRRGLEDSGLGGPKRRERKGASAAGANNKSTKIFEDATAGRDAVDKEVEKFMRGEVSPSKKGDLDCIQGLLSLSQGNWR